LYGNRPNPFRQTTTIKYEVTEPRDVSLKVYNIAGQLVKMLVAGRQEPGYYSVNWGGKDNQGKQVANGVYLYRLSAGAFSDTRKMVMLR
jgi:flagellar hook assembly protein FlgD